MQPLTVPAMNPQISRLIAISFMVERPRHIERNVIEKVLKNICLIEACGCSQEEVKVRGLCSKQNRAFHRAIEALPTKKEKAEFEISCIEKGLILSTQEARQIRSNSPFKKVS